MTRMPPQVMVGAVAPQQFRVVRAVPVYVVPMGRMNMAHILACGHRVDFAVRHRAQKSRPCPECR